MHRRWRLIDWMRLVAMLAVYLAALHYLCIEPGHDVLTIVGQVYSMFIVFVALPLHLIWALTRIR